MTRSYALRTYTPRTYGTAPVPLTTALSQSAVAARIAGLKSTAYYNPNNWTWYQFETYSHSQVDADLATIAADGFNDVRLVIPVQDGTTHTDIFGVPTPSDTALTHLDDFIATAHTHGLTCNFTLFDHAPSTIYTNVSGCQTWVDAVVGRYSGDSRISFMDLRNEMDGTNSTQMAWARAMIPYIRGAAGGIPITISVQNPNYAKSVIDATYGQGVPLDLFNMHFYDFGRYWVAPAAFRQLAAKLSGSPIYIGEVGFPTPPPASSTVQASPTPTATTFSVATGAGASFVSGRNILVNGMNVQIASISTDAITLTSPGFNVTPVGGETVQQIGTTLVPGQVNASTGGMQAYQEVFVRAVQSACQQAGIPLACPWIYYDQNATGSDQYYYGLRSAAGTAKPALTTQKAAMSGAITDLSVNNGMESGDTSIPYLWYSSDGGGVAYNRDTTVSHSGTASLKCGIKHTSPNQFPKMVIHPLTVIVPGQSYTFSAWVKGDGACTGTTELILNFCSYAIDTDAVATLSSPASSPMSNSNTSWVQLSVTATAPANSAYAELYLYHNDTTGTVWFDDVAFG